MPKGLHAILQNTSESEKAKKKAIIRKAGIRSRKSKTERQYNGKKKIIIIYKHCTENKSSSSSNTTKFDGEHGCSGGVGSSRSTCGNRRVTLLQTW